MIQYKTKQKSKLMSMGCLKVKTNDYNQAIDRLMKPDDELFEVLIDAIRDGAPSMTHKQASKLDTSTIEYEEDYVHRIKESYYIGLKIYIPFKSKRSGVV